MASPAFNANGGRNRALRARVIAEESRCGICNGPVDKSLTMLWGQHGPRCTDPACPGCIPHPMRPEVDHIVPRSKGGAVYDRSNCRLTHRTCNGLRGDGSRSQPAPPAPLPTIGGW